MCVSLAYYENQGYYAGTPQAQPQFTPQGANPNFASYPNTMRPNNYAAGTTTYIAAGGGELAGGDASASMGATGLPSNHCVNMRGLPWSARDNDIIEFFQPLNVLKVSLILDEKGRSSGKADVYFSSHADALAAMQKNRQHIGQCDNE